ncbi:MAG: hypothetical protein R3C52_05425 [Hyphomonadaceae bacterium]
MSLKVLMPVATGLLALAGCVGNGVELGGTEWPQAVPANSVPCEQVAFTHKAEGKFTLPSDVVMYLLASEDRTFIEKIALVHDVTPEGKAVNVKYMGSPESLKHGATRSTVKSAADALQSTTFEWPGQPGYATGCVYRLNLRMVEEYSPGRAEIPEGK